MWNAEVVSLQMFRRSPPEVDQTQGAAGSAILWAEFGGKARKWSTACACFPIFHPDCLVSSAVWGAVGCMGQYGTHSGLCRLTSSKEAERSTKVWCLTVTSLPQISGTAPLQFSWPPGSASIVENRKASSPALGKADSPVVSQKVAKRFGFVIAGLTLKKKWRFLKRHVNLLFVYRWTYLRASMRMLCFKSLHIKGRIQGKCCSRR